MKPRLFRVSIGAVDAIADMSMDDVSANAVAVGPKEVVLEGWAESCPWVAAGTLIDDDDEKTVLQLVEEIRAAAAESEMERRQVKFPFAAGGAR